MTLLAARTLHIGLPHRSATREREPLSATVGGTARFIAATYGCRVTGIDLTDEYVETARALTDRVGLADRVTFRTGSALDLPFADALFDAVCMLHVGMNFAEPRRREWGSAFWVRP